MANYGNWYIRNDSFCTASGWACLNVANLSQHRWYCACFWLLSSPQHLRNITMMVWRLILPTVSQTTIILLQNHPEDLVAPTNLGWNLRSESATPAEQRLISPVVLPQMATSLRITMVWWPTIGKHLMPIRHWNFNENGKSLVGGTWTTDPTVYGATNTAFATFGAQRVLKAPGTPEVRSWLDQNGNNTLDDGTDVVSNWKWVYDNV